MGSDLFFIKVCCVGTTHTLLLPNFYEGYGRGLNENSLPPASVFEHSSPAGAAIWEDSLWLGGGSASLVDGL